MIERTFDRDTAKRKATAAYIALLRIANLEGASRFSRSVGQIAKDMAYSYNHAAEALELVQIARLCRITQRTVKGSKERAPSIYEMIFPFPQHGGFPESEVPPEQQNRERAENYQERPQQHPIHSKNESTASDSGQEVQP